MNFSDLDRFRGATVVRSLIAQACARIEGLTREAAPEIAARRWGATSLAAQYTRGAVAGGGTISGEWGADAGQMRTEQAEFVALIDSATAFFRIPGLRVLPRAPFVAQIGPAAVAAWKGEAAALKVSSLAFERDTLPALTLGVLAVMSNELLQEQTPEAEREIQRHFIDAIALAIDAQAFDVAESGTAGVAPGSIAEAGASVASVADFAQDFNTAAQEFGGNLARACVVMHPRLAAQVALTYAAKGIVDGGPAGGSIMGMPLLTSQAIEIDSAGASNWLLIDGSAIAVRDDGAEAAVSRVGAIEVDDAPAMTALAPTGPSGAVVSMFQTENSAVRVTRRVNWKLCRADASVCVVGASYGLGS